ncbi:N- (5'-phosphoribosyl) anthranilate isomerase [Chlamydia felis Fe/C-56]|uniref:N-(5'-phosphoribosyl)anthranilate isomerase n=1 Tax=Chlamydia felis (strain Fe/C-56) TaxID=264202 RepID=TRPF_CHLFF|nr:phosphoribosylanthranilate isomerase [Chlamydia felis]Q254S9.1 RecName: Full=N-(5'-phosphoribosyl)anthranilate isomerase; Short=PRAI [Chlamydia felis Fe/C-56]BAE81209.1 N- (5'-phosphoribosyl) anthranilate isomerase [Chlamydia felis Fe/C-56]
MKVKICGVTHPEDAEYAALLGADYIGMIFAEKSKRKTSLSMAKSITNTTKRLGAEPVGVFVEQTTDQIIAICEQTGIKTVQLHNSFPSGSLEKLLRDYSIIYAISVRENGDVCHPQSLPPKVIPLYDTEKGGTGKQFNWKAFSSPRDTFWMLAGGLNPANIEEAIATLHPNGVDVATGVEFPNKTRKDPDLLKAFIQSAKILGEKI